MTPDKRITLVGEVMAPARSKIDQTIRKTDIQARQGQLWLRDICAWCYLNEETV
jgi:hypothetical protein